MKTKQIQQHKKRNNHKEGFQHRIRGLHQDKFEMISKRKGNTQYFQNQYVDAYQDTGISEGVFFFH